MRMCSFSLIHSFFTLSLFRWKWIFRQQTATARFVDLSRCRLFLYHWVLKRGRKVLRLKDKHPSYCGSVYLFLCQLLYQPIEQNNSRRVALPTVSLLTVCFFCRQVQLHLVSCTATLWVFVPTVTSSCVLEGKVLGDYVKSSVECLVANTRCRDSVRRRRRLLQLEISCVVVYEVLDSLPAAPTARFCIVVCVKVASCQT